MGEGMRTMGETLLLDGEIDADGRLTVQLPHNAPVGHVRVMLEIEPLPLQSENAESEDELDREIAELLADIYKGGQGLTAEEILQSPEIGMWANRAETQDSVAFVAKMREKSRNRHTRSSDKETDN